jgi:hypothetical protein
MTEPSQVNEPVPPYAPDASGARAALGGAQAAMQRAAQRARQMAQQTGTDLIVMRGGRVVRLPQGRATHES